ncbi:MAG TPA: hypothetical protein VGO94_15310 [Mycobacteriales bacterium]|nr:hypothetical protein [Mycobacteriales bacterium]
MTSFPSAALADPSPSPSGAATPAPSASPTPSAVPADRLTVRWDAEAAGGVQTASAERGSTVALAGRVATADGRPATGLIVALDRADFDGRNVPADPRWAEVGHAVTADDGGVRFGVAPTRSSLFRARVAAAGERPEATSSTYAVAVQTSLRIAVTNPLVRTVPYATAARVAGVVTGDDGNPVADLPLTVERRLKGQAWKRYADTSTTADGSFAFTARTASAQLIEYRVRSAESPAHTAALSGLVLQESRHDPFDKAQIDRMVRSVRASGLKVGVGLIDRKTGKSYNYGHGQSTFYTASVAKVMVAMDVLRDSHGQGRSTPPSATASKLRSMIRNSNDAITWSYWRSRGGANVVQRVNSRCGTSIKVYNNTWSMSRPTPLQMAQVLDCLADGRALNAKLSSFLMYQMRNVTPSQRWGVPAANPDRFRVEMNKNGWWRWPCCYFWTVNSTGLFGPGSRYAFTVFTQYGGSLPQSRGEKQAYNVTRAMYPWGTIIY